jgi:haloacetate dehalogenase
MFEGFQQRQIDNGEVTINLRMAGNGPPLLLLHGYPQTHVMWHKIAPQLAEQFTVVVPDLRGYGDSSKPAAGENHVGYSKRQMALDLVHVMTTLGFETWGVAGHDRGARVSYRMALDHPDRIERLCSMDVVPTIEQFETTAHRPTAVAMYHWFMLAQPSPFPETLIGADPEYFLRHSMESWGGSAGAFTDEAMAEYIRCFSNPETIRATCDCYRAGATIDCDIDGQSREAGDKITCPTLIMWGNRGDTWSFERQLEVWRRWAIDVTGQGVPGGHFCPEEAPIETLEAMLGFFSKMIKD